MRKLLIAALLLTGCSATPESKGRIGQADRPFLVGSTEAADQLRLKVRQPLVLRLPSNASTGYSWQLTTPPKLLVAEGKPEYVQDAAPAGMVGVPGQEVWRFRAIAAGEETLQFEYRQSWDTGAVPARTQTYRINIRE